MAAVARELPPTRLVPPRPSPKSVPPPLPPTTQVDVEEVIDVSDTAVHELVFEDPSVPPSKPTRAAVQHASTAHPGVILLRTIGFFAAQLIRDFIRSVRVYLASQWARASSRALEVASSSRARV